MEHLAAKIKPGSVKILYTMASETSYDLKAPKKEDIDHTMIDIDILPLFLIYYWLYVGNTLRGFVLLRPGYASQLVLADLP